MNTLWVTCRELGVVVFLLLLSANVVGATLARQCGAVGIVTYDPIPDPTSPEAYTRSTEVPVPYAWLLANWPTTVPEFASYEAAAKQRSANFRYSVEDCYLAGLSPTNAASKFTTLIKIVDGVPQVTWEPDLNENGSKAERLYKVYGKENLSDADWVYPTNSLHRFFKVTVEMP